MANDMNSYSTPAQSGNTPQSNPGFNLADFIRQFSGATPGSNMSNWQGTDNQTNAYQDGVNKALKNAGEAHATQALQQGADPTAIANHPVMQNNDPTQILTSLIANGIVQKSMQNQSSSPSSDVSTPAATNAPVQNNNFGYKPDNPVSSFFNMLGITPSPDAQLALTQAAKNRQLIAAGNPGEIAVPQAQAQELQQRIAGAEPIQPKDIADLNRQTYSATIQAANDAWQRNTDEIKTMQEQYKALQEGRSGFSKGIGGQTKEMNAMQKVIISKMKQNQQHLSNMQTLFNNPPSAVSENTNAANAQNSPFQVGQQYNGETIKNVRRIK